MRLSLSRMPRSVSPKAECTKRHIRKTAAAVIARVNQYRCARSARNAGRIVPRMPFSPPVTVVQRRHTPQTIIPRARVSRRKYTPEVRVASRPNSAASRVAPMTPRMKAASAGTPCCVAQ